MVTTKREAAIYTAARRVLEGDALRPGDTVTFEVGVGIPGTWLRVEDWALDAEEIEEAHAIVEQWRSDK